MPARSQQQQKLMGLALAFKRGEIPASKVSTKIKAIAKSMTEKELEKFAGTPHKGLPRKVESLIPVQELRRIIASAVAEVINEGIDPEKEQERPILTPEEKQQYLEAISRFNEYGKHIYRATGMQEAAKHIKKIVEFASSNIVDESGDWFDKVTLTRHSKKMQESLKLFEKTAHEMTQLQQRLEAVYEELGQTLGRYYEIKEPASKEPVIKTESKKASGRTIK